MRTTPRTYCIDLPGDRQYYVQAKNGDAAWRKFLAYLRKHPKVAVELVQSMLRTRVAHVADISLADNP
jgi:predicted secreted Zn-dependent protease